MSPEDLLNSTETQLDQLAASINGADLHNLFNDIWEKVRPLYAGQAKSVESVEALALAAAALKLASHSGDRRLLLEAKHMMGRSLGANEQFEQAIPFYQQV